MRTMSARVCASPGSDFAPDTERRCRYRAACSGFTANTRYPAATSAVTHGPRSVSIPITTCPAPARSSGSANRPINSCSRAIPSTPSDSRAAPSRRPAAAPTRPAPPHRGDPLPSRRRRTTPPAQPPRHPPAHDQQPAGRSPRTNGPVLTPSGPARHLSSGHDLPDHRRGHGLTSGLTSVLSGRVLTHRRLPEPSLPYTDPVGPISRGRPSTSPRGSVVHPTRPPARSDGVDDPGRTRARPAAGGGAGATGRVRRAHRKRTP
jgi:hypothetical protein